MQIEQFKKMPSSWDIFIKEHAQDSGLLQSTVWSVFQKEAGLIPLYLQVKDGRMIQAQVVVFFYSLPLGMYTMYIARGPVLKKDADKKEIYSLIFEELQKIAKENRVLYMDMDPLEVDEAVFTQYGFKALSHPRQPQETIILDLNQSEQELLSRMKPKTRYNMRVAQKHGVQITMDDTEKGKRAFLDLIHKTAKRQEFIAHREEYYKKMMDVLVINQSMHIYIAKFDNKIIACHLMAYFGNTAVYLHGASLYEYRDKMAPHLLQYHQIMDAKKQGYRHYDFWGIATKGVKRSSWEGITRFKLGFKKNADIVEYPTGYRKVVNKNMYLTYCVFKKIKRIF